MPVNNASDNKKKSGKEPGPDDEAKPGQNSFLNKDISAGDKPGERSFKEGLANNSDTNPNEEPITE